MLMENWIQWIDKHVAPSINVVASLSRKLHFFGGMLCTRVDRYRAPPPSPTPSCGLWVAYGSRVRGFVALGVRGNVGQVTRLSNDIGSTVANWFKKGSGSGGGT